MVQCISGMEIHEIGSRVRIKYLVTGLQLMLTRICLAFDPLPGPITAIAFNRTGTIFAYSISYDWSKGHAGLATGTPNKIMLHSVNEDDIKRKPRTKK